MEYSIEKSRRNATEKSNKFQFVLKEQKRKVSQSFIQNQNQSLILHSLALYKLNPQRRLLANLKKETKIRPINALQKYGKLIWAIFALQMERNKTKTSTNCLDPNLESWQ